MTPGCVVADLGAGAGLHAFLAERLGAAVTRCLPPPRPALPSPAQPSPATPCLTTPRPDRTRSRGRPWTRARFRYERLRPVANLQMRMARANGLRLRVLSALPGESSSSDEDEEAGAAGGATRRAADVAVVDVWDPTLLGGQEVGLLGRGLVPALALARRCGVIGPATRVVPRRARLFAAPLAIPQQTELLRCPVPRARPRRRPLLRRARAPRGCGFRLSVRPMGARWAPCRASTSRASPPSAPRAPSRPSSARRAPAPHRAPAGARTPRQGRAPGGDRGGLCAQMEYTALAAPAEVLCPPPPSSLPHLFFPSRPSPLDVQVLCLDLQDPATYPCAGDADAPPASASFTVGPTPRASRGGRARGR